MTVNRVMLVDDHPLILKGMRQLLAREPQFEVVAAVSNGSDAIAKVHLVQPDLILLDLNMPGMSGLDTLKALRSDGCDALIVILTVSDNSADIDAMVRAGADGYLLKDTEPEQLLTLLKQVDCGNKVYSDAVLAYLGRRDDGSDDFDRLTAGEVQILREMARGLPNRQIAERLFVPEVEIHLLIQSALKKLHVTSRTAATAAYLGHFGDLS